MFRSEVLTVRDLKRSLVWLPDDALVVIDIDNDNIRAAAFSSCKIDGKLVIEAAIEEVEEDPEEDPCLADEEHDSRREDECELLKG